MRISVASFIALATFTATLEAQDACIASSAGTYQPALFAVDLECARCIIHSGATGSGAWIEFGSEPTVASINTRTSTGTALRRGDVIVAVDGALITTPAGARRLANPGSGRSIPFKVRRDGRDIDVDVEPVPPCQQYWTDSGGRGSYSFGRGSRLSADSVLRGRLRTGVSDSTMFGRGRAGRGIGGGAGIGSGRGVGIGIDSSGRSNMVLRGGRGGTIGRGRIGGDSILVRSSRGTGISFGGLGHSMSRVVIGGRRGNPANAGWLGFGLECSDCSVRVQNDGRRLWTFAESPVVAGVDSDSPADRAGIQEGDVLIAIDGHPLRSTAGASRFSTLRPGDRVRLEILRGRRTLTVTLVAVARS